MMHHDESGFEPLFNGEDLSGWFPTPRMYQEMWPGGPTVLEVMPDVFPADYNERAAEHPAAWSVEDGAIVGRQESPGCGWGGYLVSEQVFGDFELRLEAKPDWPADTGIMLRKRADTWHGLQVLVDHRQSGSIGGFYGNGISGFHAVPYTLDARWDNGRPVGLVGDDPTTSVEPFHQDKRDLLTFAGGLEEFLSLWRFDDWNDFRIRVVGRHPEVTVWINDAKVAAIDLASLSFPNYDAEAVAETLGRRGHIALEVHDNDSMLGDGRWGRDASCRWRNIRVKSL
jgi:hypothetical protein